MTRLIYHRRIRIALAMAAIVIAVAACTPADEEAAPTTSPPTTEVATTTTSTAVPTAPAEALHVASPDWREQIIYFLMVDRFADGDSANNDQGAGEYDPADDRKYQGGDIQGIIDQLDYIEGLGATSVWITPPVANQWWDPLVAFGGYHGYWAENFKEVDAHFGDIATYQELSRDLHGRGMYLIQDVVTNHTGNFFTYIGTPDPDDPTKGYTNNPRSVPVQSPSQPPFDQNDPANPEHLAADIYHWNTVIRDFNDPAQVTENQLADLDDLNTQNPAVRAAMRDSYGYWVDTIGVDGFRIDTVRHVEHEFWNDFMWSTDPAAPGIHEVAAATGRDDFLAFGEAFIGGEPYDDSADRAVASFTGTEAMPELPAALAFPMHFSINRVFAEGAATDELGFRLDVLANSGIYPDPLISPVFIDNHDVARFLAKGTIDGLEQALTFLLTGPGIPVVYYGTEQGFTDQRPSMFATGFGSGGSDHFDTSAPLYTIIAELSELRLSNRTFTHGSTKVVAQSPGPGLFAFTRTFEDDLALMVFNTSDTPALMAAVDTGVAPGTTLEVVRSRAGLESVTVTEDGTVTFEVPPREAAVLVSGTPGPATSPAGSASIDLATIGQRSAGIDAIWAESQPFRQDVTILGGYEGDGDLLLVIDGDLGRATSVEVRPNGRWSAAVPVTRFAPGISNHTVTVYAPSTGAAAPPLGFTTDVLAEGDTTSFEEPLGDAGQRFGYLQPQDVTFGRQLDIGGVDLTAFGPNLEVAVTMGEVTDVWNPANGFDHVMFHIFIDVPGTGGGATVLPRLNSATPDGFAWDVMAFVEGWAVSTFTSEGADDQTYGGPSGPAPLVSADTERGVIRFLFDSRALGSPDDLTGARVYITTWDWDGVQAKYRPLTPAGEQWEFGGGDGAVDPLIFDDTDVLTIP